MKMKEEKKLRRIYIYFLCSLCLYGGSEISTKNEIEIGQKGLKIK
jgi:hypothetical protein